MSCYFRHLKEVFAEVGIEVIQGNREQIDRAIQRIVGTDGKDCPETWAKVKEQIRGDDKKRKDFIVKLKSALR